MYGPEDPRRPGDRPGRRAHRVHGHRLACLPDRDAHPAGGDRIPLLHNLVSGLDHYRLAVQSLLGEPVDEPGVGGGQPRFGFAGVRFFRWVGGRVKRIDGVDLAATLPGLVELEISARPGDTLSNWRFSRDRPGHCVVGGHTADEVHAGLAAVEAALSVMYEQD